MEQLDPSPLKKARQINLDGQFYGTFAEIGAGQEVARYFFLAGRASQTIAKTISAYDMTVSDSIYGKSGRYVCEDRLLKMLSHEYDLLLERLGPLRGERTRFFTFADTVATSSHDEPSARCHGWMGVRFQTKPLGPAHDLILHVRMLDRTRLQQQEALAILGVNLTALAHHVPRNCAQIVQALMENLDQRRVEINLIRLSGPDFQDIDNHLLNLEMVKQGVTHAVLFTANGQVANPSDILFKKPILVQRGTFRPVTNTNVELMDKGLEQFKTQLSGEAKPEVFFELTMSNLLREGQGQVDEKDFLDRVDTLCALGRGVLLSRFELFYQVKSFLREYTDQPVALIVGASHLEKLFDPSYYKALPGGILEGFSRLMDDQTRILVFPYKSDLVCETARTFHPAKELQHLYQHLVENQKIVDILGCETVDTSVHSHDVRHLMQKGDPKWETLVPKVSRDLIKKKGLFGVRIK